MKMTIKSRKHNDEITFSRPGGYYIYAKMEGQPGDFGDQICEAGRTRGNTIGYSGEDQEQFEKICRRWYKAFIRGVA